MIKINTYKQPVLPTKYSYGDLSHDFLLARLQVCVWLLNVPSNCWTKTARIEALKCTPITVRFYAFASFLYVSPSLLLLTSITVRFNAFASFLYVSPKFTVANINQSVFMHSPVFYVSPKFTVANTTLFRRHLAFMISHV